LLPLSHSVAHHDETKTARLAVERSSHGDGFLFAEMPSLNVHGLPC